MMFGRVLLVKPRGRKGLGFASDMIPLGLEYIAASVKDVVEDVKIVDMEFEKADLRDFLDSFRPDLVGLTVSATDHYEGLHIAKIAKERGCTTVLGGYHATGCPDELLSHPQVDLIVRGEGEYTMRELIQKDYPRSVLGLSYKEEGKIVHNKDRPLIENLDALPFPARYLRRHRYEDHMPIEGERERDVISMSRGCWGRCIFCCEPSMSRGRQRYRSPENVMEELLEIKSYHRGRPLYVFVTDPNFMGSPRRVDRLCDLLRQHELDVRFSVLTRVDSIARNPELTRKMCETGILSYEMGIESPKAEDLTGTHKDITLEMQEKAITILRNNGAWPGGTLVVGLPGQTDDEIRRSPAYAKKIGLAGAAFGVVTPFPGTELYRCLEHDGLIVERDWTKYDEMHSVFELQSMNRQNLEQLVVYCHVKFWTLDKLIERARVSIKDGQKMPLEDFMRGLLGALRFAWNTMSDYEAGNLPAQLRTAAEASADPCVEEYTRKIGVHNVIEFPRLFLKVLGSQIIQLTIENGGRPITSYVMKTTTRTVEYVAAVPGRREDATINLSVNLEELSRGNNGPMEVLGTGVRAAISLRGIDELLPRLRLLAAIGVGSTCQIMYRRMQGFGKAAIPHHQ